EDIKDFFHGERPENIPVCRQVTGVCLKPVDVECKRCKKCAPQAAVLLAHNEMRYVEAIKGAQYKQQSQQAGNDAGKAHDVKLAAIDLRKIAPALERPGGNEKSGDYKKDAHAIIAAPEE